VRPRRAQRRFALAAASLSRRRDELATKPHFQIHVSEMEPAPVKQEDGWRKMDIRFIVSDASGGAKNICFWRTIFPPGAAHERHYHPNAEEVLYVLRGRGAAGTGDEEHEIGPGSAQYIPAGEVHWLRNLSDDEELEIVGCYTPAASLDAAGYVFVSEITDEYRTVS
jgi:quercetin dioxygenase-like cupin family protein